MEHNEIGTGGPKSSASYTLHGRPLAVGTRLGAPEAWGNPNEVYTVHKITKDSGSTWVEVRSLSGKPPHYLLDLDNMNLQKYWEVVTPKLNGEPIKAGDVLVGHKGELMDIGKIEWEATGGLSIHGQERGAPEGKTLYVGPGLSRPYWSKWVPKVAGEPIAVGVWPDGTNQQWSLWAPKASGEPIAVGDWIRIDEPSAPNVGVFRIVKLWPTPVDGPTRRLDVAATFEHGSYRSTRRLGDGTDGSYKARKLHPQDPSVRPVIGDLVKHPTRDAIGKITDIYGEFDRYVSVEWLGTQQGVHTHTDYHWYWARRAEKPLTLLRPLDLSREQAIREAQDTIVKECNIQPARLGKNQEPIVTQDELNEIEKVRHEKESGLLAFLAQGNPVEMKPPTDGGMSLKDLATFCKAWDEAWKGDRLALKVTQRVRELLEGYHDTPLEDIRRFYKDINLYPLLDPTPIKYVNWPSKRPEDVQLKKGDYVYHAERREFGQIDQLTESRDHTPIALVQTTGVVGKTAPIWYNTSELRRSSNLHRGAIVLHPEEGSGVVTWVNRLDTGENLCVEFNKGVKVVYNANNDDVFALKRTGATNLESSEPQEHKCVADQVCAPAVGAEVDAGTGGSLSNAELSAQTAWKPFPQYLPEKKGKYLVHFVEFGDCKVIRWKGTRWAKYNDSVSSFYTVPIEEIVPFVGAISAPALTEQQLNELDPPEFKVGDTVYDPVNWPGLEGKVAGYSGMKPFPIRVDFGDENAGAYTEGGSFNRRHHRTLSHLNYTPGYIIT